MKILRAMVVVLACLGTFSFVFDADAAIFRYVDKNGSLSFADNLQSIPESYRDNAVIVEGAFKEEPAPKPKEAVLIATEELSANAAAKQEVKKTASLAIRLMITGAVGAAAFLVFAALTRLPILKKEGKIISVVRGALIGVFSIYVAFAHLTDLMNALGSARHAVQEVEHRSEEKGKKAAQAIKSINSLIEETQKSTPDGESAP